MSSIWKRSDQGHLYLNDLIRRQKLNFGGTIYETELSTSQLQELAKNGVNIVYDRAEFNKNSANNLHYDEATQMGRTTKFFLEKILLAKAVPSQESSRVDEVPRAFETSF